MTTAMKVAAYLEAKKGIYGEMQLQKLLYYVQAWKLAWTGTPMFSDEIEAWANGPVVRNVWAARKYDDHVVDGAPELTDEERAIVDSVYEFYGRSGGSVLGAKTHQEEPWLEARGELGPKAMSTSPISQATMRRFYTKVTASKAVEVPRQPVIGHPASDERVAAAGKRQSARWRATLDALADR